MTVLYTKKFLKQYQKLSQEIQDKVNSRIGIFIENPQNPSLHNHRLHGSFVHYRSINITGDYRVLYYLMDNETAEFTAVGTHSELYG
ncbi:hypothetical protein BH11PAT2_BH11PAT2_10380 [soil metagenome]